MAPVNIVRLKVPAWLRRAESIVGRWMVKNEETVKISTVILVGLALSVWIALHFAK